MTDIFTAARSHDIETVRRLLGPGADVCAVNEHGFTALECAAVGTSTRSNAAVLEVMRLLIVNAMMPEVKALISKVTGRPVPAPPPPKPKPVKLTGAAWRVAKQRIDVVFDQLAAGGLVVLQDAGTTQEDGFADCTEVWDERGTRSALPRSSD